MRLGRLGVIRCYLMLLNRWCVILIPQVLVRKGCVIHRGCLGYPNSGSQTTATFPHLQVISGRSITDFDTYSTSTCSPNRPTRLPLRGEDFQSQLASIDTDSPSIRNLDRISILVLPNANKSGLDSKVDVNNFPSIPLSNRGITSCITLLSTLSPCNILEFHEKYYIF